MPAITSKNAEGSSEQNKDESNKLSTKLGLKKTVGLMKSSPKQERREAPDSYEEERDRTSPGRPPLSSHKKDQDREESVEQREAVEEDTYGHGVVDLWLQQNAMKTNETPRRSRKDRRKKKPLKSSKVSGDASVVTETTLKAGNFLPAWELGNNN